MWLDPDAQDRGDIDIMRGIDKEDKKSKSAFLNLADDKWKAKILIPNWVEMAGSNTL